MVPVYSPALPNYVRGLEPDFLAVGRKLDATIEAHFQGAIAIRGISVVDHPGHSLDDLVAIIQELGTDRYDPQRKAVQHELYDPYGVELHALPCTVEGGFLRAHSSLVEAPSVMADVLGDFWGGPPVDRGSPPMRLDLLIIFDPHQLEPIFVSYDGKPREGGETPQLMHSLEFRFKFPDRKSEALLGFIKILTAGYALSDRASCRGMAHSTDLRERIINAVIHKRYTLQKAADTFDVGAATVSRYLRRYRQTGDLTPRTSPGRPSALNEYQAWVEQSLISNDLTHDQRCDLLFDEIGVRISRATRCRWVQRLGSTRKKDDLRQ